MLSGSCNLSPVSLLLVRTPANSCCVKAKRMEDKSSSFRLSHCPSPGPLLSAREACGAGWVDEELPQSDSIGTSIVFKLTDGEPGPEPGLHHLVHLNLMTSWAVTAVDVCVEGGPRCPIDPHSIILRSSQASSVSVSESLSAPSRTVAAALRVWMKIRLAGLPDNQYRTHGQIALKNLQSDVTEKKSDFTEFLDFDLCDAKHGEATESQSRPATVEDCAGELETNVVGVAPCNRICCSQGRALTHPPHKPVPQVPPPPESRPPSPMRLCTCIQVLLGLVEGTLASQNTKMISSIVISQLIDGKKSRENGAVLPVPPACPMKPPLANRSAGTIHRAFAFLPGRLGIQTRLGERGPVTGLPPKEEKPPCSGSPKGFASITITARRVVPPASTLVWQAVEDPLCIRCRAQDTLLGDPPALASGADPSQHHGPFTCAGFSRNSAVMRLKVPEAHAGLCAGHEYWITNVDNRGGSFPPGTLRSGKSPPVFSSCVHLRVSQQCPNSIYYLDRSLSVPIEPPRLAGPKMHRSVLSLSLSCSSHTLTPDGAAGTVNAEPMSRALKPELTEGSQTLPGPSWNLGLQEFADAETNQVTGRKGQEDQAARCHISGHANQLSIHIPGWSYTAAAYLEVPERHTFDFSISASQPDGDIYTRCLRLPALSRSPARTLACWYLHGFLRVFRPPPSMQVPSQIHPWHAALLPLVTSVARSGPSGSPTILNKWLACVQAWYLLLVPDQSPITPVAFMVSAMVPGADQVMGDYTCCDLVVKIKECKRREDPTTPEPTSPEPAPPGGPVAHDLSEDCPESQRTPASSLTLQEALEVRKPQFISRSQERLKKLEHMVQQRKAQQKESPRPKQSLLPVRANKKQFTVPHPLSELCGGLVRDPTTSGLECILLVVKDAADHLPRHTFQDAEKRESAAAAQGYRQGFFLISAQLLGSGVWRLGLFKG
ncbi:hypothetical protein CB1_001111038 [Camelus ferus]|nr:hypothetical protein CB1_001111038 [Camelus ferus]